MERDRSRYSHTPNNHASAPYSKRQSNSQNSSNQTRGRKRPNNIEITPAGNQYVARNPPFDPPHRTSVDWRPLNMGPSSPPGTSSPLFPPQSRLHKRSVDISRSVVDLERSPSHKKYALKRSTSVPKSSGSDQTASSATMLDSPTHQEEFIKRKQSFVKQTSLEDQAFQPGGQARLAPKYERMREETELTRNERMRAFFQNTGPYVEKTEEKSESLQQGMQQQQQQQLLQQQNGKLVKRFLVKGTLSLKRLTLKRMPSSASRNVVEEKPQQKVDPPSPIPSSAVQMVTKAGIKYRRIISTGPLAHEQQNSKEEEAVEHQDEDEADVAGLEELLLLTIPMSPPSPPPSKPLPDPPTRSSFSSTSSKPLPPFPPGAIVLARAENELLMARIGYLEREKKELVKKIREMEVDNKDKKEDEES